MTATLALVVPADRTAPLSYVLIPSTDSLPRLQQLVGGFIEGVPTEVEGLAVWCNEEGRLLGLPMNERATQWWQEHGYAISHDDTLHGDVVFHGETEDDEAVTELDVPSAVVAQLLEVERAAVPA